MARLVVLAAATFVVCGPAAGPSSSDGGTACAGWKFGQHDRPMAMQLACLIDFSRSGAMASVSPADLGSEVTHFYGEVANTGSQQAAAIVRLLVSERERRDAPKAPSGTIHAALMLSGQLALAEEERRTKGLRVAPMDLTRMNGGRAPLPGEASHWTLDPKTGTLNRNAVDLSQGSRIVVYASPSCGFCLQASAEIAADPRLRKVFRERAIWIDTPSTSFDRRYVRAWSRTAPDFPLHAVFDRSHWPQRKLPATPYFFFMKDGRVVSEQLGWTAQSRREIRQRLGEIGL